MMNWSPGLIGQIISAPYAGRKDFFAVQQMRRAPSDAAFNWTYDPERSAMMGLYRKGVEMQWDANTRLDWAQELDEDNPEQLPDEMLPINGMAQFEKMSRKEKAHVRKHIESIAARATAAAD